MPTSAIVCRKMPRRMPWKLVRLLLFCVALLGSKIATPSTPALLDEPAMLICE